MNNEKEMIYIIKELLGIAKFYLESYCDLADKYVLDDDEIEEIEDETEKEEAKDLKEAAAFLKKVTSYLDKYKKHKKKVCK